MEKFQADENKSNREGNNHNTETNNEESSIEVVKESAEELEVDVTLEVQLCDDFAISTERVQTEIIISNVPRILQKPSYLYCVTHVKCLVMWFSMNRLVDQKTR